MSKNAYHWLYKISYVVGFFIFLVVLADHFFMPILSMQLQVILLYLVAIFVGLTGLFGFLSGQPFTFALAPELRYPKEGSEKDDESRAFGLAFTIVYLLALCTFVLIKFNS